LTGDWTGGAKAAFVLHPVTGNEDARDVSE